MRKGRKEHRFAEVSAVFAAMLILAMVYALLPIYHTAGPETEMVRRKISEERYVIHAGGFLTTKEGETVSYTNSYDALMNLYEQGRRICEIDMRLTPDGILVCAHGDGDHLADGLELPSGATGEEFLQSKLYGEFETMSVERLAQFMREHEDLLVITDTRDENQAVCRLLAERFPDLQDRFLVQIYHENEYAEVRSLGFRFMIYTLYLATDEELNFWRLEKYAQNHELVGMTFHSYHYDSLVRRIAMQRAGVPLMYHTINEPAEIRRFLRGTNVAAVYTDLVSPDMVSAY